MAASKDNTRAILSYATPNPVGPYKLVTPIAPPTGAGKTKTPILPVMGGALVNLPTPVMPTKQTTPVAPPLPSRLVNVPTQQGGMVNKSIEENAKILDKRDTASILRYNKILRDADLFEKDKLYGDTYRERLADYYKRGYTGEGATSSAVIDMYQDIRSLGKSGVPKENIPDLVKIVRTNDLLLPNAGSQGPTNSLRKNFAQRKGNVSDTDLYKVIGRDLNILDKAGRETYIALMPTWTGTHKELVDAARSLSK